MKDQAQVLKDRAEKNEKEIQTLKVLIREKQKWVKNARLYKKAPTEFLHMFSGAEYQGMDKVSNYEITKQARCLKVLKLRLEALFRQQEALSFCLGILGFKHDDYAESVVVGEEE